MMAAVRWPMKRDGDRIWFGPMEVVDDGPPYSTAVEGVARMIEAREDARVLREMEEMNKAVRVTTEDGKILWER